MVTRNTIAYDAAKVLKKEKPERNSGFSPGQNH
jgi:hypothetical protein